jgi:hypothetical protein
MLERVDRSIGFHAVLGIRMTPNSVQSNRALCTAFFKTFGFIMNHCANSAEIDWEERRSPLTSDRPIIRAVSESTRHARNSSFFLFVQMTSS